MALAISAFTPVILQTMWRTDIVTASKTLVLTEMYVGISYFSHVCHSVTRVFMVYVTVVVRSSWLNELQPRLRTYKQGNSLLMCAKVVFNPKWLEHNTKDIDEEDIAAPKEKFAALIDNYNTTGQFVAALHAIFQQWFVMQWLVYFIKIIEDFSIAINSLVGEKYNAKSDQHELIFVLTHLVFDLILFLIPYFCASLFNQYHDEYRERLHKVQVGIFSDEEEGWMLQSPS